VGTHRDLRHEDPEGAAVPVRDFDVVIIGSGFGGSVAALRLTEKGYRVAVLEAGARFDDHDFPQTSWNLRKFFFLPSLGLCGIQRIHFLPDSVILAGAGVGGGSLVYANTLYVPPSSYFEDPQWAHITDWHAELAPWYDQASRMLGVVQNQFVSPSDTAMRRVAEQHGVGHTFRLTPVGVHFGEGPGCASGDPFFGGVGPERRGCTNCGECMTGCRHNAKNTLPKNYLGLAEKAGALVFPLTTARAVRRTADGRWHIEAKWTGRLIGGALTFTADQIIVAAGTYNTQKLLHRMKDDGVLPGLSPMLGEASRTNDEALVGAIFPHGTGEDFSLGSAITSSFMFDEHTHVEPVRYGRGSNAMALLQTFLTSGETPRHSRRQWLRQVITQPRGFVRLLDVRRWSERTVISLIMRNLPSSLHVRGTRGRFGWRLTSTNDDRRPNPTYIPAAHEVAKSLAAQHDGVAAGTIVDLFGAPLTAHFVGGCVVGDTADSGVVDPYHRVWNYPTMHIVDGSTVTANLGVNPALTITAQAERAMSMWPNRGGVDPRPTQGEPYVRIAPIEPDSPMVPTDAPAALRHG
jgi:cholesterol oxidase